MVPQCPRVPWELSLQRGPRRSRQGPGDGTFGSTRHEVGATPARVQGGGWRQPEDPSPSRSPKDTALGRHGWAAWRGWRCPRCVCPPPAPWRPPGRGRGEQPNAFQKISCKWPGRVIHIKLIKPLLVSRGRNPDVAVYLFWISPFFFFSPFFPFNIFFQEIFKGTGTPRCVRQRGSAGAGCPRDVWSWSLGASRGALASQGVGQILGSGFRATPRGRRSWHCWGLGVSCCPEGV